MPNRRTAGKAGVAPLGQRDAASIAGELGGYRYGATWMAICPAHDDRTPSLSITDSNDRVLVHCHAGCSQRDVIAALTERGLWSRASMFYPRSSSRPVLRPRDGTQSALRIWKSAVAGQGTLAETYLRARSIVIAVPDALRFHDALPHTSGGRWPALVALVTHGIDGTPIAIHRTYLAPDGSGKAPVDPNKMMLGPCREGAVRLGPTTEPLMIGEGIETCLSAMQATGHVAWASLSTSGMQTLGLPSDIRDVIVLADGDSPGRAAAEIAASRWSLQGRRVRIARAPDGRDFNDLLMGRTGNQYEL